MRIAIMQPTYLPWCGYFDHIAHCDVFVLLDTVPFAQQRPNWQKENRILTSDGPRWLRLPAQRPHGEATLIKDVTLKHAQWADRHLDLIAGSYGTSPFFGELFPRLEEVLRAGHTHMAELNTACIRLISAYLELETTFVLASDLPHFEASKDMRLVSICKELGGTEYYAALGSHGYIDESNFTNAGLTLRYQNYTHPTYEQPGSDEAFISHLSVLDLLFSKGPESLSVIRSGHGTPLSQDKADKGA